jgi:hypothetical protein
MLGHFGHRTGYQAQLFACVLGVVIENGRHPDARTIF